MEFTITHENLTAALAEPWSVFTCLLAQSAGGRAKVMTCGPGTIRFHDGTFVRIDEQHVERVRELVVTFDNIPRHLSTLLAERQLRNLLPYTYTTSDPEPVYDT